MSGRNDRSLLLAWAIGLGLCVAGALVTRAATEGGEAPATVAQAGPASGPASDPDPDPESTPGPTPGPDSDPPPGPTSGPASDAAPDAAPAVVVPAAYVAPTTEAPVPAARSFAPRPRALTRESSAARARRLEALRAADRALAASLHDTLRRVLERAVADSAFPGAYAIVGNSRGVLARHGAGRIDWAADAPTPTDSTIWDLASLTKVVGMTSAVARLVDQGRLRLDAPVQRYLPEFAGAGKERVTVRHLLTHSAGLPSWRPLHKEGDSPAARRAMVLATPLDTAPGVRYVYSDLGAMVLGFLVEKVSGQPLDRFLAGRVFTPLRMRETGYNPDPALRPRIAPTEIDPWRQRHLRGESHDENAFAIGGVSGHAGLFSTGRDLARFARMYLNGGQLDGTRILGARAVREFTRVQDSTISRRALGWETPTGSNSAGRRMSARAFGHTGFTGTSIWIDPEQDLFVILLSNRVNPTRENRKIGGVRVALADAVMQTVAAQRAASAGASSPSRPR